ncbi:MFS transporter [Hyalangium sp.]|uniref:MFS transporter n=1 Tax=Hyalangium sp. TaxID=2028555 RepID=UPI002D6197A1|nr:MFS transporter [Hyalangium sp.]HYH96826.1 MFS transporter [Hyalangium sp.]
MSTKRAPFRELFGWAMFDFANSSYTTVIITVAFSVLFPKLIVGDEREGNFLWSVALSTSLLLVALSGPVLGSLMDFSAAKKKFLFASYLLTVTATSALYFVTPGAVALCFLLIVLSNYGFSVGENFSSSFLPDLGPPEDLGKISGIAWGVGYLGGLLSTALVFLITTPHDASNLDGVRLIGPLTGGFFLLAGIPTFLLLKERGTARLLPPGESYLGAGFRRLGRTLRELRDFRDLIVFLFSFFFAYAGLSIVISFAFIYGDQVIRWSASSQAAMFVLTNISAAAGAWLFGFIQDRIGDKRTYSITLVIWMLAVVLLWGAPGLTEWLNGVLGTQWKTESVFLSIGALAGLCLGSTQSAARAMVGVFSPESKAGEFYGFWGLFGKLSAIFGLMSLGFLQIHLGLRGSILLCVLFFFISLVIALFVNEKRGREMARQHTGE